MKLFNFANLVPGVHSVGEVGHPEVKEPHLKAEEPVGGVQQAVDTVCVYMIKACCANRHNMTEYDIQQLWTIIVDLTLLSHLLEVSLMSVCWLVVWSVGWSLWHNFLNRQVTLRCSYLGTCLRNETQPDLLRFLYSSVKLSKFSHVPDIDAFKTIKNCFSSQKLGFDIFLTNKTWEFIKESKKKTKKTRPRSRNKKKVFRLKNII